MIRSLTPWGRDGSDLATPELMAKPTPDRRCSSSLLPIQKNA